MNQNRKKPQKNFKNRRPEGRSGARGKRPFVKKKSHDPKVTQAQREGLTGVFGIVHLPSNEKLSFLQSLLSTEKKLEKFRILTFSRLNHSWLNKKISGPFATLGLIEDEFNAGPRQKTIFFDLARNRGTVMDAISKVNTSQSEIFLLISEDDAHVWNELGVAKERVKVLGLEEFRDSFVKKSWFSNFLGLFK